MNNPQVTLKLLLLGESNVGKTTILSKYVDNIFSEAHINTIGVECKHKVIKYKDLDVRLQIWDSSGQEVYRAITKQFYRGADGFIFIYDLTREKTFECLKDWLTSTEDYIDCKKIIVGNKKDLEDQRVINKEIIERFSNKTKLKCFEVSAKDGTNIDLIFKEITNLVFENKTEEEIKKEYMLISQSSSILSCDTFKSSNEKKKCC